MEPSEPPPILTTGEPPRHGCLTTWLVLIVVLNALTALATPFTSVYAQQAGMKLSPLLIAVLVACAVVNVVCAVALFRWQRWGFYGIVAVAIIGMIVNLAAGLSIGKALFGFIGVGILYWVLNMGGPNKAWPRLK